MTQLNEYEYVVVYQGEYEAPRLQLCVNDQDVNDFLRALPNSVEFEVFDRFERKP